MLAVPVVLAAGGGYFWLTGGRYVETDNAYVQQNKVSISSDVAGRIASVAVKDSQAVKAGDALFTIDPEPYRIALAQADAALASARVNVEQLRVAHSIPLAKLQAARDALDIRQKEWDRTSNLRQQGITAESSLDDSRLALQQAQSTVALEQQDVANTIAALGGNPDIATDDHPAVRAALAARDNAQRNLDKTTVVAPADGIVAQVGSLNVGQFINTGSTIATLVESSDVWVEANFKETQLTTLRNGMPAEITVDAFPGKKLSGHIDSIGAATGAEFALISARRPVIEPRAEEGHWAARITLGAMERVSLMMAGAQLGITLCTLGLGALAEPAIAHGLEVPFDDLGIPESLVHPAALVVALFLVGGLHVVLGEMVPKNIALAGPDRSALALGPPIAAVVKVLHPVIWLLNKSANGVLRLLGVTPSDEVTSAFTRDEVAGLVEESSREGMLDADESRLLTGALEFEERDASAVLLPLDTMVTLPINVTPAEVEEASGRTGFSRFPVTRDGEMIGYLHLKDALEVKEKHRNRPIAESWVHPLPTVRLTDRLREVLEAMQGSGAHLARVVVRSARGRGKTVGVVALEDVLEELIGEVRDAAQQIESESSRQEKCAGTVAAGSRIGP